MAKENFEPSEFEKPSLDDRDYKIITLSNGLEALLIHDATTDRAAAALDVAVGSFTDPDELPGLAHAIEHLLFMGTKKFPVENEYSSFLAKRSGYSNAFTASCSTNYYFELSATPTDSSDATSPLYGALDRFSQFFINPLFLADTIDRELRAVDSENCKNLNQDVWRLNQVGKSLSSPSHPYHKFSTGSYATLHDIPISKGMELREEFINFYKTHYSANRMKLVVLGSEPLEQLESWVKELFTDVPNQNLPQLRWDDIPVFGQPELATQTFVKPIKDGDALNLEFLYPYTEDYKGHASRYISHLIGHEGPGSILAYIKEMGWANSLSSGSWSVCPGTSLFDIDVRLTEAGLKNYQKILVVIFQYIAALKQESPHEWIVKEMMSLAQVDFRFRQKANASSTVSGLAGSMQKPLPRPWLLSGETLIREFDPEGIRKGIDALRPDNFRYTVVTKDESSEKMNQTEKWYGTEYRYEKIPAAFLSELEEALNAPASARPANLHLPGVNAFVPERLDVDKKEVKEPAIHPTLIRNDDLVRTFFKRDDTFWVPKANIEVLLRSPLANTSPLNFILSIFYTCLVEDSLEAYAYDAELAGLGYSLNVQSNGLSVSVRGYNDKIQVLLEKVLLQLRDIEITQDRFSVIKEKIVRDYGNMSYTPPFRQIGGYTRNLMCAGPWLDEETLIKEANSVTLDDVRNFVPQLLKQLHIEILVHGHLFKEDALNVSKLIETTLRPRPFPPSQWPSRRAVQLPTGADFVYKKVVEDENNVNHCLEYTLLFGPIDDTKQRATLAVWSRINSEPAFDTLRTKEQLGYVVSSGANIFRNEMAWRLLIQSERDCDYLESRCDAFLESIGENIRTMSDDEFEANKLSEINSRLEKLKTLGQESSRFHYHIGSERFEFDSVQKVVAAIRLVTKQDVLNLYEKYIDPASASRAKIAVHLIAKQSAKPTSSGTTEETTVEKPEPHATPKQPAILIEDVKAWRDSLPLGTAPRPVQDLSTFEETTAKL